MQSSRLNLSEPWDEVKEKLKEANVDLTDDDLEYQPGSESELLQRMGRKLNKPEDEVRRWVESISMNSGKAG